MAQSAPQVVIDRATDGTLTFDWSVNDVAGSGTGFWDDATPLPVGVYEAFNHVTTINGGVAQNTIRLDTSSLGRNNIIIHGGSQTSSEGCFIINASDRNAMFNAITTAGYELGDLTVNVRGDVGYQVDISTSASVEEGGALSCTVSLSGAGAADGLLRDLNVRVSLSGSAANPIDFTLGAGALSVPTSGGAAAGANEFWITIPAGQSSATALLPTVFDNVTEGNETAVFTVADLQFVRNGNRVYQPDTRQAVEALIGSKTDSSEIVDKDSILGKDVNANGGVEGYDEVHNFAPGQSVNVFFDPYTIPDSLTISDVTTGRSYVNTGFIGGSSYSGSFTIDKASRGELQIRVGTNDPGTAWEFSLTSPSTSVMNASARFATAFSAQSIDLDLFGLNAISVDYNLFSPQVIFEGLVNDTIGSLLTLNRVDTASAETLGWRIIPQNAVSAVADFSSTVSGTFQFVPGQSQSASAEISALEDNIFEGSETFTVEVFRNTINGEEVLSSSQLDVRDSILPIAPLSVVGAGDGSLTGTPLPDIMVGNVGNDTISGLAGGDFIGGDSGDDQINGGSGDDFLAGGFGDDTIDGGVDIDTALFVGARSSYTLVRLSNGHVIVTDVSSALPQGRDELIDVEFARFSDLQVDLSTLTAPSSGGGGGGGGDSSPIPPAPSFGDDALSGTAGNDTVALLAGQDSYSGFDGDDLIYGGSGPSDPNDGGDTLYGDLGSDTIYGNGGDDVIYGGRGLADPEDAADTIYGGLGNDIIYGNGGNDVLYGNAGSDTIRGGVGSDTIVGGDGQADPADAADVLYGDEGDDLIFGNAGDDVIYGGRGFADPTDGSDTVYAGIGNDIIYGNGGNDRLFGNEGNDALFGGAGNDVLTGGTGADRFYFSPTANEGRDTIADFNTSEGDRLYLQGQSYTASAVDDGTELALSAGGFVFLDGVALQTFQANQGSFFA